MTTSAANPFRLTEPDRCTECGEKIINRGVHWERCTGPRAYGQCECEPGWLHDPKCWLVTGGAE